MKTAFKIFWNLLKKTFISWYGNDSFARSATIAYYALFSFPTLLVIVLSIAGNFFQKEDIQEKITTQLGEYIGTEVASDVEMIIENVSVEESSVFTWVFGIIAFFIGATGMFFQMKMALNNIWNVAVKKASLLRMIKNRLISFGMIMILGLLLLITLVISILITALGDVVQKMAPQITAELLYVLDFFISFLAITTLIAAIFKILPDVVLKWKVAYVGASLTTLLFLFGEFLLSIYLNQSSPGMIYGAASSVIIILIWVFYTCLIVFFGAEFTVQYALYKNEKVIPAKNAEPAIYRELRKLKTKKMQLKEEKKIIDILQNNPENNKN